MAEDRTDLQMLQAPVQAGLELQAIEQRWKDDEPGERGRLLILEADLGQRAGRPADPGLAMLHRDGRFSVLVDVSPHNHTRAAAIFSLKNQQIINPSTPTRGESYRTAEARPSRGNYRPSSAGGPENMHLTGQLNVRCH